ncbi:dihydroorotate dehydrogenase (fumarate) [Exophiala oligosperma]|uniref:Dihydroorotate dehydrogenase (quinone), mitochondrial n=2 Tax=Chaetothyriales TaxID=34395 RepID=A0A0D2DY26_9EURO|nr:dihydroorotate dehydrogenase (fumarate) [Exophiala oligosperma]KAJ9628234.1 Dihydroorotate dehydrogenase (quinone), mitochondrial [Knufia peltigerae]KIW47978.1 dihydroorotate dehydrogenase (fumarate) [Exophiala oligosperma]
MKLPTSRLLFRPHQGRVFTRPTFAKPRFAAHSIRRHNSTAQTASTGGSRILNFFYGSTLVLGLGIIFVYVTDTRASVHRYVVIPALRWIYPDPEEAHHAANQVLRSLWDLGLYPRERGDPDKAGDLEVEVFGRMIRNPIATSAGMDKHADIPDPLFASGPAIVEIGGTTPLPQSGNDKPRVFRLTSQQAMINRYGLNSEGADHVAMRLRDRVRKFAYRLGLGHDAAAEQAVLDGIAGVPPGSLTPGKLLAINIAKNKITPEDDVDAVTKDYVYCVNTLGPYADILVVNVSSPNTPGLRSLQQSDKLQKILTGVVDAARSVDRKTRPAVMVKVSPDEDSDAQISGICDAVWAAGVDGVIVGNTTNRRPGPMPHLGSLSPLEEQHLLETGGFSGPHLFDRTLSLVKRYRKLLEEKPAELEPVLHSPSALQAEAAKIKDELASASGSKEDSTPDSVTTSVDTGVVPVTPIAEETSSEKQPLLKLPQERFYDKPQDEQDSLVGVNAEPVDSSDQQESQIERLRAIQAAIERLPPREQREALEKMEEPIHLASNDEPKVIFATGGITNGKQALDVLNAGASVAMVYTALVYGGIGTISRIKDEMRAEMRRQTEERRSNSQE